MAQTLVERTQEILASVLDPKGKAETIQNELRQWEKENRVVRAVLGNHTTFVREYDILFGPYHSGRVYAPYRLEAGFAERAADLEACLGPSPLDESYVSALNNPVALAPTFGLIGMVLSVLKRETPLPEQPNRRAFLKHVSSSTVAFFAAVGGVGGGVLSYSTAQRLDAMRASARYLDEVYADAFVHPSPR